VVGAKVDRKKSVPTGSRKYHSAMDEEEIDVLEKEVASIFRSNKKHCSDVSSNFELRSENGELSHECHCK
jgi:hypothetical protein